MCEVAVAVRGGSCDAVFIQTIIPSYRKHGHGHGPCGTNAGEVCLGAGGASDNNMEILPV